jgi:hypothetical protein
VSTNRKKFHSPSNPEAERSDSRMGRQIPHKQVSVVELMNFGYIRQSSVAVDPPEKRPLEDRLTDGGRRLAVRLVSQHGVSGGSLLGPQGRKTFKRERLNEVGVNIG